MSLLDPYATAAEYRARTGDQSSGIVAELDEALLASSRQLERSLMLMPGAFNVGESATYYFDSHGGQRLGLRDEDGRRYFFHAITAIGIDSEYDGTFDGYSLTLTNAWVRGLPANAAAALEPWYALELLPGISGAAPSSWLRQPHGVKVTGTSGWATIPQAIKELTVHRTHELRTALKEGGLGTLPSFDDERTMQPRTSWLWKQIEQDYGARIPSFG